MENEEENRSKRVTIRFKPTEFDALEKRFKKTLFREISQFMRELIMQRPVTVLYRDKAMDEILEELILLRRELNAVGNNLNQAMRQINSTQGSADSRLWSGLLQSLQGKIEPSIAEIKSRINKYADIWSQRSGRGDA